MKNTCILLLLIFSIVSGFSQPPQKMSYQCVVRNSSGALVADQNVGIRISILQGSPSGNIVYQETYNPNPQTNANGLVNVEIGGGTPIIGIFSNINWASGTYFLKTETDPTGGTNYTIFGTSQLLSVPYAMYAKTAENGFSGNYNDLTNKPSFSSVATSGSYIDLLNKPIQTLQTKYLLIAGGTGSYARTPNNNSNGYNNIPWAALISPDGTDNLIFYNLSLPVGAVIKGIEVRLNTNVGKVLCQLGYSEDGSAQNIAAGLIDETSGWHWTPEKTLSLTITNEYAYTITFLNLIPNMENSVGTIRIKYEVSNP